MPSRKRNKGQARKAKAAAAVQPPRRLGLGSHVIEEVGGPCNHGLATVSSSGGDAHVCNKFLRVLFDELSPVSFKVAHKKFPDAVDDAMNRSYVRSALLSNGASNVLEPNHTGIASAFAAAVIALNGYHPSNGRDDFTTFNVDAGRE